MKHVHRLDLRTDGEGLRKDPNRRRRLDEHTGIGRVQDHEILLQDGLRHEGNQERGSGVYAAAEVLHLPIKGGAGTHPIQELCSGGTGRQGDDKGRTEQTRVEIKTDNNNSYIWIFICIFANE